MTDIIADIAAVVGVAVLVVILASVLITMFLPPKTTPYEVPAFSEAPTLRWVVKGSAPVPVSAPGRHRLVASR